MMNDRDEIKQGLKDRILDLCVELLPGGRRIGRLYVANNPVTQDYHKDPEFKVALDRDTGAWRDWRTGEKGDVLSLVTYCLGCDFPKAMDWARDFLGFKRMSRDERKQFAERAARAKVRHDQEALDKQAWTLKQAVKLFENGMMDGAGSAAELHGKAYFAARHCPLDRIANRDLATFRFSHETEYWKRAEYRFENGRRVKTAPGPKFPAIHTAMRSMTGQVTAVHVTFLHPSLPAKAPVGPKETAKLMFGAAKGSMIRISHGPEGEPPETARQAYPLILCEGIEDGLSLALACPEARVWAAGSLSAMMSAPVNMTCISHIIVSKDNDWANETALKQFDDVFQTLAAYGKPIATIASHIGKDFNDLITEE